MEINEYFVSENIIDIKDLVDIICEKVETNSGFSFIRIGDGELGILSQDLLYNETQMKDKFWWYSQGKDYCGVSFPNHKMQNDLIKAIKNCDIVGIFHKDTIHSDLTNSVFKKIDYIPEKITYAFANISFFDVGKFIELIKKYPPLLIGRLSEKFAEYLYNEFSVEVPGFYTDINSPDDINPTIDYMIRINHSWSLLSAGANAKIIAPIMSKKFNKVSIDFGGLMYKLLEKENKLDLTNAKKGFYI